MVGGGSGHSLQDKGVLRGTDATLSIGMPDGNVVGETP